MERSRSQVSVRRLMLVVAILAALLAAFEAGRRWERANPAGVTIPSQPYMHDDVGIPTSPNPNVPR